MTGRGQLGAWQGLPRRLHFSLHLNCGAKLRWERRVSELSKKVLDLTKGINEASQRQRPSACQKAHRAPPYIAKDVSRREARQDSIAETAKPTSGI